MRRLLCLLLFLLCLAGCGSAQMPDVTTSICSAPASEAPALVPPPGAIPFAVDTTTLWFQPPAQPYRILGAAPYGSDWILLYEEEFPDEYNKIYSNDSIFHALRWQKFSSDGLQTQMGDSLWSNSFPIATPISHLTADPESGLLTFSHFLEQDGGRLEREFTIALRASALPLLGENPNQVHYTIAQWSVLPCPGDTMVQVLLRYEDGGDPCDLRLQTDGLSTDPLCIKNPDPSFLQSLYAAVSPSPSAPALSVQLRENQLTLSNEKMTYQLDFLKKTVEESRQYTTDLLDTLLATSPDGNHAIWLADTRNYFESPSGGDLVYVSGDTIQLLTLGSEFSTAYFPDNQSCYLLDIDFFGRYALPPSPDATPLPCDFSLDSGARLLLGSAYDPVQQYLFLAHRENTFGDRTDQPLPVTLTILDAGGKKIFEEATALSLPPFGKMFPLMVEITPLLENRVTLQGKSANDEPARVTLSYLA